MPVDLRPAAERFVTTRPGSLTRHSFSFGHHYDPDNVSFGPVVAVNDEVLDVGAGFDEHEHRDLVIVTYVVSGSLAHQGISDQVLEAGEVGVLSTGASCTHAERNAGDVPLRLVQTWLAVTGLPPSYEVVDGPVRVGDWQVCVDEGPRHVTEGHVLVVATGDAMRVTPPGVDLDVDGPLVVVERAR